MSAVETVIIVADPYGDGYGFCTEDDGDYGAPSLDEAILLARSLGYDYEVES